MELFGSLSARRFACILGLAFKWNREHILSKLFQQIVRGVTDEDKRGHSSKDSSATSKVFQYRSPARNGMGERLLQ